MKSVFSAAVAVWSVCGKQKYRADAGYRLSNYSVQVPCDDGLLLYNTFTGAMYLLEKSESIEDNIKELVENRFLVPDGMNETQYTDDVRTILSTLLKGMSVVKSFTILTTTACNARCFYCYQAGSENITMSEKTALDTAAYIARVSGGEEVSLHWFGGEPLCNVGAIDTICAELRDRGVAYHSKMVSNGYLFTTEIARRAASLWKLRSVEITLDGTKEVYLSAKAYANGDKDAFERVVDNISCLADNGIKTIIRMNMDSRNAEDLLSLCGFLASRFSNNRNICAYPVLLKGFVSSISEFDSEAMTEDAYIRLDKRLVELGLSKTDNLGRVMKLQRCMADNDKCEVIMPDGSIEKCEHFSKNERLGTIYGTHRDERYRSAWKERVIYDSCADCALYPLCIELKKCPWSDGGCTATIRSLKLYKLKKSILAAYKEAKSE